MTPATPTPLRGIFVTGTGTGVGKTAVSRGLARLARRRGRPLAALKPLETGVDPDPLDALALERACGLSGLARAEGLYRARLPVAPAAATLAGETPPPGVATLAARCVSLARAHAGSRCLVEGAGGILVPISPNEDILDLARTLPLTILLVTGNALGVLSHTRAAVTAMQALRCPAPEAVVLVDLAPDSGDDPSRRSNRQLLADGLGGSIPVLPFPFVAPGHQDPDEALADAAEQAGLGAFLPA